MKPWMLAVMFLAVALTWPGRSIVRTQLLDWDA